MSVTDAAAEPVQPEEGQGAEGTAEAPYAEYLNRIPETVRGDVEPIFQEWDANVTRRFQEASEYRKSWEPYEQSGVNNYDPEAVSQALQFYQAVQTNPQGVWDWAQQYAQEHGLTPAQAAQVAEQAQQAQAQEFGTFDTFGTDPTQLKQLLDQSLQPLQQQLEAINQWRTAQETQAQEQKAREFIQGQLSEIREKHPAELTKETEDYVKALAGKYMETDPQNAIPRAWADYQKLVNMVEKRTLQPKVATPPAAESGGVPDVTPEQIKFKDTAKFALEQLRAQRG